jgi:hypothetical protein
MNETVKNVISNLTKQREDLDAFKTAINDLPRSRGTALADCNISEAYRGLKESRISYVFRY